MITFAVGHSWAVSAINIWCQSAAAHPARNVGDGCEAQADHTSASGANRMLLMMEEWLTGISLHVHCPGRSWRPHGVRPRLGPVHAQKRTGQLTKTAPPLRTSLHRARSSLRKRTSAAYSATPPESGASMLTSQPSKPVPASNQGRPSCSSALARGEMMGPGK
jgi:hypothetical protein